MRPSRGMGDIAPSKMPGKKIIKRKDKPQDVEMYKKGGRVKKFDSGGGIETTPDGLRLKKDKVSLQDAAGVTMSKDSSGRPTYGAKTPIGTAAAQKSYDKNWMKKESADDTFDRTIKARDEADDEAQRESNRGIKPENRKAKGGKVGLYENIHKKQKRIKSGSGERMRPVGAKGAPSKTDFIKSAKTARKK